MNALLHIKRGLDWALELLVIVVFGILVVAVLWQVAARFILGDPSDWTEELATFLMIWVGLLGACVALRRKAHLGIDYLVSKLSVRNRAYTDILTYFIVAAFSASVLMYGGGAVVRLVWTTGQVSPALGLRMAYVYLALPVSGFFLTLYSLALAYEAFLGMRGETQVAEAEMERVIE